jgi:hypothetical protein
MQNARAEVRTPVPLTVGLLAAGNDGGLQPFAPDALHAAYRDITEHYPYAEFRLLTDGCAAQLSNGPRGTPMRPGAGLQLSAER